MRRALILALLAIPALPMGRLTWLFMAPPARQSVALESHSAPTRSAHFVNPREQPASDPLQLLHRDTEPEPADLANVRAIVAGSRPSLIIVTRIGATVGLTTLDEINHLCTSNGIACVQLDIGSGVHGAIPHADIRVPPDASTAHKPDGLYFYDAQEHLLWECPAAAATASMRDLSTIVRTIGIESKWQSDQPAPLVARQPGVEASVDAKSPTPKLESKTALRLSAIDGQIADAINPSKGWISLRRSWPATVYLKTVKRPILLVFWATWCAPCMKEFTQLDQMRDQYQQKVLFVGLADEQDSPVARDRIAKAVKGRNFRLHYLLKDSSISRKIFGQSDVPLPAFALFDAEGQLFSKQIGSLGESHNADALRLSLDSVTARQKKVVAN